MDVIINTYGTAVSRDAEGFVIENAEGCQRIPAEGLKSIQICRGAQISSDAVMLAIAKEIEVLFVGKGGRCVWKSLEPKLWFDFDYP